MLREPTVLMRDVQRARLAVGKMQPTSTTQMVFASNPGNCSSNLVSVRTASAMPAFVTADHTSDKLPYNHKRNLSELN